MMQTIQNRTTNSGVLNNINFGTVEHGKDVTRSIEKKNHNKKLYMRDQQEEIRDKIMLKKEMDMVELKRGLNEMDKTDRDFQIRELKLA